MLNIFRPISDRPRCLRTKISFVQVPGYAALLTKAKQQLQESLDIAATLKTLGDTLVEQKSFIEKLRACLMGDTSVPTIEMHDNVHIDDEGEWLGRDIEAKYMVNINQFFALGLDRSAVNINVTEYCKYRGKTAGEYDESMSKALDMAMCRVSESEVKNINQQSEEYGAFLPFYFLDHESLQNAETGIEGMFTILLKVSLHELVQRYQGKIGYQLWQSLCIVQGQTG